MADNLVQQLMRAHLVAGEMRPGSDIALKVDQTLSQDATGTLVMLAIGAGEICRRLFDVPQSGMILT